MSFTSYHLLVELANLAARRSGSNFATSNIEEIVQVMKENIDGKFMSEHNSRASATQLKMKGLV